LQRYVTGFFRPEAGFPVQDGFFVRCEGLLFMPYRVSRVHTLIASAFLLLFSSAAYAAVEDSDPRVDLSQPHALPLYPENLKHDGFSGTVVLAVHVNEIGKPFFVQAASSSGNAALDQAGIAAVRRWRFLPATRDGQDIAEWTAVGFTFGPEGVSQVKVSADTEFARKDRNKIICKVDAPITGSHIDPAPVCLPKWQWQERAHILNTKLWNAPKAPAMGGAGGTSK
jgi:TonB family protein